MSESKRVRSIDVSKGFAIFTIVLVHLLFLVPTKGSGGSAIGTAVPLEILYSGLMLFFLFSGYFYRPERGVKKNVKKRFVQLMLTYYICATVLTVALNVYLVALGYEIPPVNLPEKVVSILLSGAYGTTPSFSPVNGMYFLPLMFFALIILYAICDKIIESKERTAVAIVGLVSLSGLLIWLFPGVVPFHFKTVPMAAAFMILGAYMAKTDFLFKLEQSIRNAKFWAFLLVCLVVGVVLATYFPLNLGFNRSIFGSYGGWSAFPFFILSASGMMFMYCMMCLLAKVPVISNILAFVGNYSLGILMLHTFVAQVLVSPFFKLTLGAYFPSMPIEVTLLVWILSIAISIAIVILVKKMLTSFRRESASKLSQ